MTPLVLDASAIAEQLLATETGRAVSALLGARSRPRLHVPHLAITEVTSVLRGWVRGGRLPTSDGAAALADLVTYPAQRWPTEQLLLRVWDLRDNVTTYDATYLALAEALDAELVTTDRRLARAATAVARCPVTLAG